MYNKLNLLLLRSSLLRLCIVLIYVVGFRSVIFNTNAACDIHDVHWYINQPDFDPILRKILLDIYCDYLMETSLLPETRPSYTAYAAATRGIFKALSEDDFIYLFNQYLEDPRVIRIMQNIFGMHYYTNNEFYLHFFVDYYYLMQCKKQILCFQGVNALNNLRPKEYDELFSYLKDNILKQQNHVDFAKYYAKFNDIIFDT